ncbi:hypothetical protein [Nostoc sp.]|uniref:hypothetical protein n=1 Tax=Nostoc sp. TaxID=1180 RepID=UPI002FF6258E
MTGREGIGHEVLGIACSLRPCAPNPQFSHWVQSRLKVISILPLNLAQTLSLLSLCQFLATQRR